MWKTLRLWKPLMMPLLRLILLPPTILARSALGKFFLRSSNISESLESLFSRLSSENCVDRVIIMAMKILFTKLCVFFSSSNHCFRKVHKSVQTSKRSKKIKRVSLTFQTKLLKLVTFRHKMPSRRFHILIHENSSSFGRQ